MSEMAQSLRDAWRRQDYYGDQADQQKCGHLLYEAAGEIEALEARLAAAEKDAERYRWLADVVLYSDYGDNRHPNKLIGWRVSRFISPVAYGPSIDAAIDACIENASGCSQTNSNDHSNADQAGK